MYVSVCVRTSYLAFACFSVVVGVVEDREVSFVLAFAERRQDLLAGCVVAAVDQLRGP